MGSHDLTGNTDGHTRWPEIQTDIHYGFKFRRTYTMAANSDGHTLWLQIQTDSGAEEQRKGELGQSEEDKESKNIGRRRHEN